MKKSKRIAKEITPCLTFLGALAGLLVGSDPWGGLSRGYFRYHLNEAIGWIVVGGAIGFALGMIIFKLDVISKRGRGGKEEVDDDEVEDNRIIIGKIKEGEDTPVG